MKRENREGKERERDVYKIQMKWYSVDRYFGNVTGAEAICCNSCR